MKYIDTIFEPEHIDIYENDFTLPGMRNATIESPNRIIDLREDTIE